MQFLSANGDIIEEYPHEPPTNYLNFRFTLEEWLKDEQRQRRLASTSRWVVTTCWIHEYLSDGNKIELEPMITRVLPAGVEKQLLLERVDPSGWTLSDAEWKAVQPLNGRVIKGIL